MVAVAAGLLLAASLAFAAVAKALDGPGARAALSTYGIRGERGARTVWLALIASEAALAAGAVAGWRPALALACALLATFAVAQGAALATGRAGAPCACLGARGRLGIVSLARTLGLLGVGLVALVLPRAALSTEQWLGLGLAVALLGLAALSVVVLALAREIGLLRLAQPALGALDVPGEGPDVGARLPGVAAAFDAAAGQKLRLAVFTSEGCAMCRSLAPVVAGYGRHPAVALRAFDEVADAPAWAQAGVPGSPYAVVLGADGAVLAKGTFNSGAQLETVLGAAERRRAAAAEAASFAGEGDGDVEAAPVPPATHAALAGMERR